MHGNVLGESIRENTRGENVQRISQSMYAFRDTEKVTPDLSDENQYV